MTELTEKEKSKTKRLAWLAPAIALLLVAEVILAVATGNRRAAAEAAAEAAAAEAAARAAETTPPPAPLTLSELLGVTANDWSLRLVRSDAPLPADYAPPALEEVERGEMFDARAAAALRVMIAEARADGYTVYVCSGYRSYETQRTIYDNHIKKYMDQGMTQEQARARTLLEVNSPGGSEHQLGLAADILEAPDQVMEPHIGGSGLMLWLERHCAEYGFIVRYPEGKTDITGVEYEPWHLRYVGACAPFIMESGMCFEEFLDQLS